VRGYETNKKSTRPKDFDDGAKDFEYCESMFLILSDSNV